MDFLLNKLHQSIGYEKTQKQQESTMPFQPPNNLSGKTAIVTGASRGIGAGIALDLAQRGANVVVNYTSARGEAAAADLAKKIEATGSKVAIVKANVGHFDDLKKLVDGAISISENGKIDILVHNAATGDDCFLEDLTEQFFQKQTDVNLKGDITLWYGRPSLLRSY